MSSLRAPYTAVLIAIALSLAAGCGNDSTHEDSTGPEMRPGENCLSCHGFSAAGTVFGAADASASDGMESATITLKDATGITVTMSSNAAGNFFTSKTLKFPLSASLTKNGVTQTMTTPVSTGACATCHTNPSANGAPGRLFIPSTK